MTEPAVRVKAALAGKLGIVGGMGPAATARLMGRVVDFTKAERDQDHLDVTVLCRPQIPDRTAFILGRPGARSFVGPVMQAAAQLEDMGCDVVAVPCNTAHAYASDLVSALRHAHFVSMVDAVGDVLAAGACAKAGLLSTEGTVASGVYARALGDRGVSVAVPNVCGQQAVTRLVYRGVKAGGTGNLENVAAVCEGFSQSGCDAVVLACTELSLLGAPASWRGMDVVDSLDVLALACVVACGAPVRESEVACAFPPRMAKAALGLAEIWSGPLGGSRAPFARPCAEAAPRRVERSERRAVACADSQAS